MNIKYILNSFIRIILLKNQKQNIFFTNNLYNFTSNIIEKNKHSYENELLLHSMINLVV